MNVLNEMLLDVAQVQLGVVENLSWDGVNFLLKTTTIRFNTMSSWRIVYENRLIVGCEDDDASKHMGNMMGKHLVKIRATQIVPALDPEFVFEDGSVLQIFSATTSWESWVITIQGADKVYVSMPS